MGVIWSDLEPEPGVFDTTYLQSIEQTVQTLGNHGVYSIIGFHQDAYSTAFGGEGAPDWAVQTDGVANPSLPFPYNEFFNPAEQQAWQSFWSNSDAANGIGLENNYSQMLEYVTHAFNGNSDVAGFELMNEPSPGSSTFLSTLFGNPFFDSQQLTPFYDQGADAIRAVDPSTPIFFEPNVLSNAGVPPNWAPWTPRTRSCRSTITANSPSARSGAFRASTASSATPKATRRHTGFRHS